MSGTPKYNRAQLAAQAAEKLRKERERKAKQEAKKRAEAEERERKRRMAITRDAFIKEAQSIINKINLQRQEMYPRDHAALLDRANKIFAALRTGNSESGIRDIACEIPRINSDINSAMVQKKHDDEEKKIASELEKQSFALSELSTRHSNMSRQDAIKFDSPGHKTVCDAIETAKKEIAEGSLNTVITAVAVAENLFANHLNTVTLRKTDWEKRKSEAEGAAGELIGIIAGLKADEVVMRWHEKEVGSMELDAQKAEQSIRNEQFDYPHETLLNARKIHERLIADSNALQIKADQRDYIAQSIAGTLDKMGFIITETREETPGHPASALVFGAVRSSGKSIYVSVPVEGEIYYNVDGYAKSTANLVGGGTAPVCDEAESVLNEMRLRLEEECEVHTGEILWEGKADPDRILRTADELPSGGDAGMRGNMQ
jgi:DNA-binding transcriptional regulator YiaG